MRAMLKHLSTVRVFHGLPHGSISSRLVLLHFILCNFIPPTRPRETSAIRHPYLIFVVSAVSCVLQWFHDVRWTSFSMITLFSCDENGDESASQVTSKLVKGFDNVS